MSKQVIHVKYFTEALIDNVALVNTCSSFFTFNLSLLFFSCSFDVSEFCKFYFSVLQESVFSFIGSFLQIKIGFSNLSHGFEPIRYIKIQ